MGARSSACALPGWGVASAHVRRLRAATLRGIGPALNGLWTESPRTQAAVRLDRQEIRARAFQIWESDKASPAAVNWLRAERQLQETMPSIERRLAWGMGRFPTHVHLDFAERFIVTEGAAIAEFDGDQLRLTADPSRSTLYIPPGVPHVNPYNDDTDNLEFRQSFIHPTEGSRTYVETLAAVVADGCDADGELPWPLILAIGDITRDRTYLTPVSKRARRTDALSFTLQRRILLPIGNLVAGLRDYTVHLDGR